MTRDNLRGLDYFNKAIIHSNDFIAEEIDYLKNTTSLRPLVGMKTSAGLCDEIINKLVLRYSFGDATESLKSDLNNLLEYREMQKNYADSLPSDEASKRVEWENLTLDRLQNSLWWLAFAVCLDFDQAYVLKALDLIDNKGLDALFDKIAVTLGEKNRPLSDKLLYPKYFNGLFEVIKSPSEKRPILLKKYLDGWYKNSKGRGWHDLHLIINNFGYSGYWCFEAALIVKIYNIDDSSFRDHQYYPAALVHGD